MTLDSSPPSSADPTSGTAAITQPEIERKFLLKGLPTMPDGSIVQQLEQGYLPVPDSSRSPTNDELVGGRIRRITHADGRVTHHHTVKTGRGLVRMETERQITAEEFERAWLRTRNRRLRKSRRLWRDGPFVWAVDQFDDIDLVLAEVEMPDTESIAPIPPWLEGHIAREVTDDPRYGNYTLALAIGSKD